MPDNQRPTTVSRRTALKAIGGGALATSFVSGRVGATSHCDVTVGDGSYSSIQSAIDASEAGDTICVTPGEYNEDINVDKSVTLEGTSDPVGGASATIDGSVTVSGDGATVSHLEITRSETIEPGGLDPAAILVTEDDVTIEGNLVTGITANAGADSDESVTLNGIQIWNSDEDPVHGVTIRENVVQNLENISADEDGNLTDPSWPNYGGVAGIKVQGVVNETLVEGNQVQNLHSAGWAWGIVTTHTGNAPGISPKNTTVRWNTVSQVNDGSRFDVYSNPQAAPYPGATFGVDGNSTAAEATVEFNNFLNSPIGAQNKDTETELVAECNYWDHATGPDTDEPPQGKASAVAGPGTVDFTPWSVRKVGRGKHPEKSCVGGIAPGKGR